jgi:hypothetical protein
VSAPCVVSGRSIPVANAVVVKFADVERVVRLADSYWVTPIAGRSGTALTTVRCISREKNATITLGARYYASTMERFLVPDQRGLTFRDLINPQQSEPIFHRMLST